MRKANYAGWCFGADCHDVIGLDLDDVIEGSDIIPIAEPAYRERVVVSLPALTESERADLLLAYRLESRIFPLPRIVSETDSTPGLKPRERVARRRIRRIQRERERTEPTPAVRWDEPLSSEQAEVVTRIQARNGAKAARL